jgi:hypothetical protein
MSVERRFTFMIDLWVRWRKRGGALNAVKPIANAHAKMLCLAAQVDRAVHVTVPGFDFNSLLTHAIRRNVPEDVCFVLIEKGFRTHPDIYLHHVLSPALIAAMVASDPEFYGARTIVLSLDAVRALFYGDLTRFNLFAKWGRVEMRGVRPLDVPRYGVVRDIDDPQGNRATFPRLRLLRLLPDYDNFVNVIVSWRRGSKYDIAGIERMIWRCLVGNLKF